MLMPGTAENIPCQFFREPRFRLIDDRLETFETIPVTVSPGTPDSLTLMIIVFPDNDMLEDFIPVSFGSTPDSHLLPAFLPVQFRHLIPHFRQGVRKGVFFHPRPQFCPH